MWKSIIYKEWLKIRWFLAGFTVLGIMGISYLFLTVQHGFNFQGGTSYWYNLLFMRFRFFDYLKFLPLCGGLLIGVAQYIPETLNKRIKLSFHLPLHENRVLLMMQGFGSCCLLLAYLLLLGVFLSLSSIYFPSQVVYDLMVSVIPWFLAGFVAYFFAALVVLEPNWIYRFLYAVVGGFLVTIYMKSPVIAAYAPALPGLSFLAILLSVTILFPAYRFRKGEM